jgi:uncharacterized protein YbjQ (UPF0145 family)
MICSRCRREFPSAYHFKVEGVCLDCYGRLSDEDRHQAIRSALMKYPMTSTTFGIEGYRITKQLGVVRGISVRSRSILGNLGAGLQTILGGEITLYAELCEKARGDAFALMHEHAVAIGANAVVGIRYDANEVSDAVTEVLCYGTAVVVEPIAAVAG